MTTLLALMALVAIAALGVVWLVLRHLRYCRDPDARGANAGLGRSSRSCGRNSVSVAAKHYLQTTDEHFERAVRQAPDGALYDALYHPGANACKRAKEPLAAPAERKRNAVGCNELQHPTAFGGKTGYPLGESNPCYWTENPVS